MLAFLLILLALAALSLTLHVTDFVIRGILWLGVVLFALVAVARLFFGREGE
jgi:hypothetical protein